MLATADLFYQYVFDKTNSVMRDFCVTETQLRCAVDAFIEQSGICGIEKLYETEDDAIGYFDFRYRQMSPEGMLALIIYHKDLAQFNACSAALFQLAIVRRSRECSSDEKATAKSLYVTARDMAARLSGGVDITEELSECALDAAYVMSADKGVARYSIRLGREIGRGSHSE